MSISERITKEDEFKDFLIRAIEVIIDKRKPNKHVEISIKPHTDYLDNLYDDEIRWRFEKISKKENVPWIALWSKHLAAEPARGIFPIFYLYTIKEKKIDKYYLILALGRSVKNKPTQDWDENLKFPTIKEYFESKLENQDISKLPLFKKKISYDNSMVFQAYEIDSNKIGEEYFQNKIFEDFKILMNYYVSYGKKIRKIGSRYNEAYETEYQKLINYSEYLNDIDFYDANVSLESKEQITQTIESIEEDTADIFENENFSFPLNVILYGPPGTGKTYKSKYYSVGIIEKNDDIFKIDENEIYSKYNYYKEKGYINFITFHQEYSYNDFIEGIMPNLDKDNVSYYINIGIFKSLVNKAKENPKRNYVLIIDEINRGNISKIFGDTISLIEDSKRLGNKEELELILPLSKEKFSVPNNLYIIGTMNSVDRSTTNLDSAMQRRFKFFEFIPNYELLKNREIEGIKLNLLLKTINEKIEYLLENKNFIIGHSYFINLNTFEELKDTFKNNFIPLLKDCFQEDYIKIIFIFNKNNFIRSNKLNYNFDGEGVKISYYVNEKELDKIENYKKIYSQNDNSKKSDD